MGKTWFNVSVSCGTAQLHAVPFSLARSLDVYRAPSSSRALCCAGVALPTRRARPLTLSSGRPTARSCIPVFCQLHPPPPIYCYLPPSCEFCSILTLISLILVNLTRRELMYITHHSDCYSVAADSNSVAGTDLYLPLSPAPLR